MPITLSQYNPTAFDSLPTVADSGATLSKSGGDRLINEALAPIFVHHKVEELFGIGLLHRHFEMDPDEILVEVNNVSSPWLKAEHKSIGGSIAPQSWLFSDGKLIPYEFEFIPQDVGGIEAAALTTKLSAHLDFLDELYEALKAIGLAHTLGLRAHPDKDFEGSIEVTCGRSNINFHPSQMPEATKSTQTAWFFDPEFVKRGCVCKCNEASERHEHIGHRTPLGS